MREITMNFIAIPPHRFRILFRGRGNRQPELARSISDALPRPTLTLSPGAAVCGSGGCPSGMAARLECPTGPPPCLIPKALLA